MRTSHRGFLDHLNRKPPQVLYHYTSLEALMKIVSSSSLLATDSRYLNDTEELTYVKSMIANRLHIRLPIVDTKQKAALNWLLERIQVEEHDPVYVSSFSTHPDDLSQWRGYTPPNQGVCIGFNTIAIQALQAGRHEHERFLRLAKIIYLDESKGSTFDSFITDACDCINVVEGEVVRAVVAERLIVAAMPFYKHSAFRSEREWRLRISANSSFIDDPLPVEWRLGKSSLVPATRIAFEGTGPESSFIREIIIGPTPEQKLSVHSVRAFLQTNGLLDVAVKPSAIPYRTW